METRLNELETKARELIWAALKAAYAGNSTENRRVMRAYNKVMDEYWSILEAC